MGNVTNIRREKLIEGVLQGKTPATAAKEAGYSDSYARVDVYRVLASPSVQERIQARIDEAQIDSDEVLGTLVSHMRADLADIFPDNEILQRARQQGVSHLIKKMKVRERFIPQGLGKEPQREVTTEIEIHDAQAAAKQLSNIIGFETFKRSLDTTDDPAQLGQALFKILKDVAERAQVDQPIALLPHDDDDWRGAS